MKSTVFGCVTMACVLVMTQTTAAVEEDRSVQIALRLPPGEGNPRNSEGDFIRLKDGRILFVYTRFSGGGSDHDSADLVSRVSTNDGRTWSSADQVVLPNEGSWNVMSVSLLRMADDRIALFYLRKNSLTDCRPYVRFSKDEGQTWQNIRNLDDDPSGWFCYTAIEITNDHVLLGHVAGKQAPGQHLATTRITRFPIGWLYNR